MTELDILATVVVAAAFWSIVKFEDIVKTIRDSGIFWLIFGLGIVLLVLLVNGWVG